MKQLLKITLIGGVLSTFAFAGGGYEPAQTEVVPVQQTNKFYIGAGANYNKNRSQLYSGNSMGVSLRVGYDFYKYASVELRGIYGVSDKKSLILDYSYGAYLKLHYAITDKIDIYSLVGYAKTKIENKALLSNNTTTQKDFSYGAGVEYKVKDKVSIYVEALRLIDKKVTIAGDKYASKVTNVEVGANYHF